MKPLYLDCNLGLGDHILCNGLVRHLAQWKPGKFARDIILPCWERNLPTVRHMFSDLPAVRVVMVEGDGLPTSYAGAEILSIGINYRGPIMHDQWDKAFYDRAGVPFEAKWDRFHVPASGTAIASDALVAPYSLVHDDPERGMGITRLVLNRVYIRPGVAELLTDWRNVIRAAAEIHCIDSSVMHLAELLPTTGKLVYHKYARAQGNRQHTDAVFRKPWVVLE